VPAENDFVREVLRFYPNLTEAQLRVVLVNDGPVILPELRERLGTYAEKKLTERKVEMRVNTKIIRHEISRCATTCPHCGAPRDGAPSSAPLPNLALSRTIRRSSARIHGSGETYKGKWNWAAFFGGAFWAFAKGLWVPLAICILAGLVSFGILGVVYWIILGARGNFLYYKLYVKNRALVI